MKESLVISCPASSRSGYGDHSRDIIRSLIALDRFDIKIMDQRWGSCDKNALTTNDTDITNLFAQPGQQLNQPDVWIQVTVPNEFQKQGKFNIGITAGMETDKVSQKWIEGCNNMDLVITTSNHSKASFVNSILQIVDNNTKQQVGELKVETPIEVLFEGINTDIFHKTPDIPVTIVTQMESVPEDFCFLVMGHWLKGDLTHDRKDIGGTISTFIQTFKGMAPRNRPALILKISGSGFSVTDRNTMIAQIESITSKYQKKDLPKVYLFHGDLTPAEVNGLYNHPKIKAMVSFTHGEGFGRPLLEFSVTQKPVIASNWSGHIDFLTKSVLLPGELKNVHPSAVWEDVIIPESKWFYVNYPTASNILKAVYESYSDYVVDARKQAMISREQFNHGSMTVEFGDILDKYVSKKVELKLPKLNKIAQ